jgi:aminoglycoside phosphotransferase (APT) family kinase protein
MKAAPADTAPEVDPTEILRTLGLEPVAVTQIVGGWDTLIWRFQDASGARRSLRLYWLPDREEAAEREVWALRHCEATGFPAPRVQQVTRFQGLPVLTLSWCEGRPVLSMIESRPWQMRRLCRLFGAAQARLHAIKPPEISDEARGSWVTLIDPEFTHLAAELRAYNPSFDAFIHMDFQPLNILTDGRSLTGVVDWAGAAVGDVRADLARTEVTLETAPAPPGPMRGVFAVMRRLVLHWWKQGYRSASGGFPETRPFRRWAAASLLREVTRVMGRPAVWAKPEYADCLRRLADGEA